MHEDKMKSNLPVVGGQPDESENLDEEEEHEDSPEKMEEMKLRAKYPQAVRGPPGAFLQKKMQQRKYFDSGDYNMAKAKGLKLPVASQKPVEPSTPVKPQPEILSVAVDETGGSTSPTGTEIPTPEKVPARKTSIVQMTASKLSPHPLFHHSPTSTLENIVNE